MDRSHELLHKTAENVSIRQYGKVRDEHGAATAVADPAAKLRSASIVLQNREPFARGSYSARLLALSLPVVLFVTAYLSTAAAYGGDTLDYVDGIQSFLRGNSRNFFDFGHLLWRAFGYAGFRLVHPLTTIFVGTDLRRNIVSILLILGFLGGLLCTLFLHKTLLRLKVSPGAACLATTAFLFSNAFLNYTHTGCAYIPGLAGIVTAVYLLSGEGIRFAWLTVIGVGALLSFAVACWFPFVLAIPAVLLMRSFLFDDGREHWKLLAMLVLATTTIGFAVYSTVAVNLHLHNVQQLLAWINASSHGVSHRGTVPKVLFGFARSWVDMNNEGVLIKRYLLHDPYNPVSRLELVSTALIKFGFFYLALGWVALRSIRQRRAARAFTWMAIAAVPIVAFGYYWEPGAMERYLAVFPFLMIAVGSIWTNSSEWKSRRSDALVGVIFVIATVLINGSALYREKVKAQERAAVSEMNSVLLSLPPNSHLVVQEQREQILKRDYFLPPDYIGHYYHLVETGHSRSGEWRQEFAKMAMVTWGKGGQVWVTKCFLSDRPTFSCNWTEGDDKNLRWHDVELFFAKLDRATTLGGTEGFVLIPQTTHNYVVMRDTAAPWDENQHWQRLW